MWSFSDIDVGSRETAMATRRFERIAVTLLLLGGSVFGGSMLGGGLIAHAQAQQPSAPAAPPPTTPTQSPTVNPSNPGTTQQPSYRPLSPPPPSSSTPGRTTSTPSTVPSNESTTNEQPASTNAPSERETSTAKTVHKHYPRHATAMTYACSYLGCVRTYAWAFPCQYYSRYCFPYVGVAAASVRWSPGYYDYAPGEFRRARYLGRGYRAGYWGD